ncbi:hypothetical protein [Janthinobacterium sp.]|uniref:hypothetical protein n=1 Tax=Janthinobacterium sp. TaxID=1871054 RepID=UPI00293D20D5|nr:hypothetical protein [Janthinobacterium sp.]
MSLSSCDSNTISKKDNPNATLQREKQQPSDNDSDDEESFQQYFTTTIAKLQIKRSRQSTSDSSDESESTNTFNRIETERSRKPGHRQLNRKAISGENISDIYSSRPENSLNTYEAKQQIPRERNTTDSRGRKTPTKRGSFSSDSSNETTIHKRENILNTTTFSQRSTSDSEGDNDDNEQHQHSKTFQTRHFAPSEESSDGSIDDKTTNKRDNILNTTLHKRQSNLEHPRSPKPITNKRERILNMTKQTAQLNDRAHNTESNHNPHYPDECRHLNANAKRLATIAVWKSRK